MSDNPEYWLPSDFLKAELGIERWNNIPLPLVNATEQFERSFGNVGRIIKSLIEENKRKSEFIVNKFRKVE